MLPVDLLIFDLDGTLVDTRQDLTNAVNYARKKLELQPFEVAEVMQYVGEGARNLLERTLPPSHRDQLENALDFFRQHYREHLLDFSTLYPGVREILMHFQSKQMAVISNKPAEFTRAILAGPKVDKFFKLVLGGDSLPIMKPSPEPILHVLSELNVQPDRALIIGDGATDIQAGKLAGIFTCAVTYGFRSRETLEIAHPDFLIDLILELKDIFK